jgi:hypothetical protein
MKKQIFIIILFTVVSINVFGQFKLEATGTNEMLLRTGGVDRIVIKKNGDVGIGTYFTEATLDVNGDLRLSPNYEYLSSNMSYNPFPREGKSAIIFQFLGNNPTATIYGFDEPAHGKILYVANDYAGTLILKHNHNNNGDYTKSIQTNTLADVTISGRGGAILIYAHGGWRLIAYAP